MAGNRQVQGVILAARVGAAADLKWMVEHGAFMEGVRYFNFARGTGLSMLQRSRAAQAVLPISCRSLIVAIVQFAAVLISLASR